MFSKDSLLAFSHGEGFLKSQFTLFVKCIEIYQNEGCKDAHDTSIPPHSNLTKKKIKKLQN